MTRAFAAAFLTALVGAIEGWFYERFFAPDLYAAGSPLWRAAFFIVVSFPFILVALFIVGLPTAYALHRARVEGAIAYAATGAIFGTAWGALLGFQTTYGYATSAFYGCFCALFWWILRPRS